MVSALRTQAYPEASGHFATFPPGLVEPCLRIGSTPGSWALDPFVGSGTTALSAGLLGRKFIGIELNPMYLEIARRRLLKNGFVQAMGI